MEKRPKRWSHDETKALLHFYTSRQREFEVSRKRRLAYENVVEDLISAGFDSSITAHQCEIKMQTLLRAYKSAKDNCSATGASPCTPPFFKEMEEVFGNKPIHSASRSINTGTRFLDSNASVASLTATATTATDSVPSTSSLLSSIQESIEEVYVIESLSEASASNVERVTASKISSAAKKKKKITKTEYLKAKLELKEREMKNVEVRFQQRQREKMERFKLKKELMEEMLKKMNAIICDE